MVLKVYRKRLPTEGEKAVDKEFNVSYIYNTIKQQQPKGDHQMDKLNAQLLAQIKDILESSGLELEFTETEGISLIEHYIRKYHLEIANLNS